MEVFLGRTWLIYSCMEVHDSCMKDTRTMQGHAGFLKIVKIVCQEKTGKDNYKMCLALRIGVSYGCNNR